MNTKKYFCVEWKRCFQSLYIYAGVVGAWVMWMYSTQGETMGDVLNCFMLTSQSAGIILVFMLCTLGHGISFFEDTENRYFYYQAVRGSLKRYVVEKSIVVYLSSVFSLCDKPDAICSHDSYEISVADVRWCSIQRYGTEEYLWLFTG